MNGGSNPRNLHFGTTSSGLTPIPKGTHCNRTADRAHRYRPSRRNGRNTILPLPQPNPNLFGPAHGLCTLKLIRRRDTKNKPTVARIKVYIALLPNYRLEYRMFVVRVRYRALDFSSERPDRQDSVKLTTLQPSQRLRMRGAMHPLPQYAFTVWCLSKHRGFTIAYLSHSTGYVFPSAVNSSHKDTK